MTLYPALVIVLLAQAPQDSVRELIEKFRSGDVVVREEATRKLKELGKAAKVELEKAVKDPDGEVARLATSLVERLTLQETLAPRLQEQIPGLADKLAFGGDPEWTQAFLAVALKCGDSSRLPILTRKEIEPLASRAARGAETEADKAGVAQAINSRRLQLPVADLLLLLDDPRHGTRPSIIESVNRAPPEQLVRRLTALTRDERALLRGRAISDLGVLGIRGAIPDALRLLKDEDVVVRAQAVEALSDLQAKEKALDIVPLLNDEKYQVRYAAFDALETLYAQEAIPAIEEQLKDEEMGIREAAVKVLADLGSPGSIPRILPLLKDLEGDVRLAAVRALGRLGARDAIPNVKALLSDPEDSVKNAASYFLDDMDPKRVLERLKNPGEALNRGHAAEQLGELGGPEAVAGLVEALKDKDEYVGAKAAAALARLGDRRGLKTLQQYFSKSYGGDYDVMRALADLGSKESIPKFVLMLGDKSGGTRMRAVLCLHILDAKEAAPKIEPLLKDPDVWVRQQAVFAMAKLQGREWLPRILCFLHDKENMVVWAALHSLALMKAWDAEPEVARLLEDLDPSIRFQAASWLARAGSTKGVPEMLDQDIGPHTPLNVLRMPEVWKRLEGIAAPLDLQGTVLQKIEKVAAAAELKVEAEPALLGDSRRTLGREDRDLPSQQGESVAVALWALVPRTHDLVIEKDRIRLMTLDAGERFWRDWWKDCQASKK